MSLPKFRQANVALNYHEKDAESLLEKGMSYPNPVDVHNNLLDDLESDVYKLVNEELGHGVVFAAKCQVKGVLWALGQVVGYRLIRTMQELAKEVNGTRMSTGTNHIVSLPGGLLIGAQYVYREGALVEGVPSALTKPVVRLGYRLRKTLKELGLSQPVDLSEDEEAALKEATAVQQQVVKDAIAAGNPIAKGKHRGKRAPMRVPSGWAPLPESARRGQEHERKTQENVRKTKERLEKGLPYPVVRGRQKKATTQ